MCSCLHRVYTVFYDEGLEFGFARTENGGELWDRRWGAQSKAKAQGDEGWDASNSKTRKVGEHDERGKRPRLGR